MGNADYQKFNLLSNLINASSYLAPLGLERNNSLNLDNDGLGAGPTFSRQNSMNVP